MRISIAMTTYNGGAFVAQQLDSIRNQTMQADEVYICDDCSTDATVDIIRNYINKHSLPSWHLVENISRLGWKENFRKSISMTTGEVVFFSDQDDVWKPWKIERMTYLMKKYDMGCLYGFFDVIDKNGQRNKKRDPQKRFTGKVQKVKLTPSFFNVNPLGCCMAVNRRIVEKYLELDMKDDDHDSQCPRIALIYDTLYAYDAPIISYRIHSNNTSGSGNEFSYGSSDLCRRINGIKEKKKWLCAVLNDKTISKKQRKYVCRGIKAEDARIDYLRIKWKPVVTLLPYWCCYRNFAQFMGDFAYKHCLNKKMGFLMWHFGRFMEYIKNV